ncbi:MAG: hypothetical protein K2M53_05655 [Muribaculaceae bacterium]|nr:hypothetical protein [Muribaculaceae bacterium]
MVKLKVSAWDFNPTDSVITMNLHFFLDEWFKSAQIVILKENGEEYTRDQIVDLANDILAIRELGK